MNESPGWEMAVLAKMSVQRECRNVELLLVTMYLQPQQYLLRSQILSGSLGLLNLAVGVDGFGTNLLSMY